MSDKLAGGVKAGSTSVSLPLELRLAADSTEKTGAVYTDVTGSYWRQGGVRTSITMATLGSVNAAYSSGGFVEVDGTNQPGVYRFDVPDAAFATGADWVVVTVKVASCFVQSFMFQLETVGAAELSARIPAALTGNGNMKSSLMEILATALTETSGQIAAAFKKFFNIATPASTMDALTLVATATDLTNAPTNGDLTAAMKASVTTAATAATPNLDAAYDAAKTAAQPGDIPTADENALALLKYDFDGITGEASHSPLNAMRSTRNDWSTTAAAGKRRVYKEDGTTTAFDQTLTTDPDGIPITGAHD